MDDWFIGNPKINRQRQNRATQMNKRGESTEEAGPVTKKPRIQKKVMEVFNKCRESFKNLREEGGFSADGKGAWQGLKKLAKEMDARREDKALPFSIGELKSLTSLHLQSSYELSQPFPLSSLPRLLSLLPASSPAFFGLPSPDFVIQVVWGFSVREHVYRP